MSVLFRDLLSLEDGSMRRFACVLIIGCLLAICVGQEAGDMAEGDVVSEIVEDSNRFPELLEAAYAGDHSGRGEGGGVAQKGMRGGEQQGDG